MHFGLSPVHLVSWILILLLPADVVGAPVTALAFTPDGTALLSGDVRSIAVRHPTNAFILNRTPCDLAKITSLAIAPDGRRFAVSGGKPGVQGSAIVFQWPERTTLIQWDAGNDLATSIAFDPDGTALAVAGADHIARVYRLDVPPTEGTLLLSGHAGPILGVAFSPAGDRLVTVSADRSVKVWSSRDGHLLRTFTHHTERVHAIAFRPWSPAKGSSSPVSCATAGDDRTIRVWQPEIGRMVRIVRHHDHPILAIAYAPDGSELYSAGAEGVIRRIDPDGDTIRAVIPTDGDWIYALAVSPDGAYLASSDWRGTVRIHPLD